MEDEELSNEDLHDILKAGERFRVFRREDGSISIGLHHDFSDDVPLLSIDEALNAIHSALEKGVVVTLEK